MLWTACDKIPDHTGLHNKELNYLTELEVRKVGETKYNTISSTVRSSRVQVSSVFCHLDQIHSKLVSPKMAWAIIFRQDIISRRGTISFFYLFLGTRNPFPEAPSSRLPFTSHWAEQVAGHSFLTLVKGNGINQDCLD
uniref:Uncharacterized protein n=1 Tax=Pipistrellus kuhlii TaxID=59472 RepID=A0A7J7W372_PIPKU|nr:hypothetical protein mPipKuh1_008151 [Pipistrellus kuhlii]